MTSREQKIASAIADTPMPDDVRAELVERLADDMSDRASFSRTAWLLACTPREEIKGKIALERDEAAEPPQAEALWLGRIAASAWLYLRGWQGREELEADLVDFLGDEVCKPKVRTLLLSMIEPPAELV